MGPDAPAAAPALQVGRNNARASKAAAISSLQWLPRRPLHISPCRTNETEMQVRKHPVRQSHARLLIPSEVRAGDQHVGCTSQLTLRAHDQTGPQPCIDLEHEASPA